MEAPQYRHLVEVDGPVPGSSRGRRYDGPDAADAMAAWSRAVAGGAGYVMLESLAVPERPPAVLAEPEPGSEIRFDNGIVLRTRCGHSMATCHTDRCFRRDRG